MRKILIIYFYLFIVVSVIEFSMRAYVSFQVAGVPYFSIVNWIDLIVTSISLIGFYGYLYQKRLISRSFWKAFFIILIGYFFWGIYVENKLRDKFLTIMPEIKIGWGDVVNFTIVVIITLPIYIGIYFYGFKFNLLWDNNPN